MSASDGLTTLSVSDSGPPERGDAARNRALLLEAARRLVAEHGADAVTTDDIAAAYRAAHERYLADRESVLDVDEIAGISAGGMPDRVKCLHVLVAHALAAGPGVNPLGDEALAALPDWWADGCCGAP